MRIKHTQLDGLFVYRPVPFRHLSRMCLMLRLIAALSTFCFAFFFNMKLMKWGAFQLAASASFLINKELFLKFTSLSVLVTLITEVLTRLSAYWKCASHVDCFNELLFLAFGVVYSVSSVGMIYGMLITRKKMI